MKKSKYATYDHRTRKNVSPYLKKGFRIHVLWTHLDLSWLLHTYMCNIMNNNQFFSFFIIHSHYKQKSENHRNPCQHCYCGRTGDSVITMENSPSQPHHTLKLFQHTVLPTRAALTRFSAL